MSDDECCCGLPEGFTVTISGIDWQETFPLLSCVALNMSYIQWCLTMDELALLEKRRGLVTGHQGSKVEVLWDDGFRTISEAHGLRPARLDGSSV